MIKKILCFVFLFVYLDNQAQTCIGVNKFVSGPGGNKWIRADYAPYLVVGGVYYGASTTIDGQILNANLGDAATVYAAVLDTNFNLVRMFNVLGLKSYGGVTPTRLWDMHVDKNGNIYFCGNYTQDTLISGTDTVISADSYQEAFVVAVDAYGNSKFLKSCGTRTANTGHSYQDLATAVTTDGSGNVYFVVNGQGTYFELDSITVNAQQFSPLNGYYDVFTVSLDSLGSVRWIRNCGTANKDDSAYDIAADSIGNVSITGTENGSNSVFHFGSFTHTFIINTNGYHGFVARYDNSGNEQWLQSIETYYPSGPNVGPFAIVVDDAGNTYAGGYFDGYVIFGADTIRTLNSTSNYLAKYTSTGKLQYLKTGKIDAFYPYPMEMDLNKDKILITGQTFTNQLSFGQYGACCSNRSYIVQYDTSGTVDWLRAASTTGTGTGINFSCALGANNEAYVSGYAQNAVVTLYPNTLSGSASGNYYFARIGTIVNSPFTFSIALNGNDTLACGTNVQIVSSCSVGSNAQITWWTDKDTIALPNFYTSISASPRMSSTYIARATFHGCSLSDTVKITVLPLPVDAGSDTTICANSILQVETDSIFGAVYSWKPTTMFSSSSSFNPYFLGTASTPIVVSVKKSGCASYDTASITVIPLAVSDFSFSSLNYAVDFVSNNLGGSSFLWDFGDGSVDSTTINPSHLYDSSLVYRKNCK
ncbi:MAG: hypothetical protein IPP32_09285 [Bacteroidetes bacterium]|nr:hypothetical protein [Bacteroidota bacterium]